MVIIIGRYVKDGQMLYRLLNCNLKDIKSSFYRDFTEQQLETMLRNGMTIEGVELVHGVVKGINGSLDRFDTRKDGVHRPFVILQEYVTKAGERKGYLFSNFDGLIKATLVGQALVIASKFGIQNGKYVPSSNGVSAYISPINGKYKVAVISDPKVVKHPVEKPNLKPIPKKDNNDPFTPAQKAVIRKGQEAGVNVSVYAHPAFSPEQMEQILQGLKSKIMVKYYAHPEFSVECMEKIRLEMTNKFEVRPYANPKYNVRQMEQIRLGMESGIDYAKYSDPSIPEKEMEKIRIRLESELWDIQVQAVGKLATDKDIYQFG